MSTSILVVLQQLNVLLVIQLLTCEAIGQRAHQKSVGGEDGQEGDNSSSSGGGGGKAWIIAPTFAGLMVLVCCWYFPSCLRKAKNKFHQERLRYKTMNLKEQVISDDIQSADTMKKQEYHAEYIGAFIENGEIKTVTYKIRFYLAKYIYGERSDADGHVYITGYFGVWNGTFKCKWVECPQRVNIDYETANFSTNNVNNALQKAKFYIISTVKGHSVDSDQDVPDLLSGYYETNIGTKGKIDLVKQ